MRHAAAHADPTWTPALLVAVVGLGGYAAAAATVRSRTGRSWSRARTLAFACGVLLLALGLSPAVTAGSWSPARAHMAQHVLVGMAAPVGLVLGAPLTLVLAALPVPLRRRGTALLRGGPVRCVTHPLTAGVLHVGGLYALYLTPLHALTLRDATVHAAVLVHTLLAGCLLTWALVGPERSARRPGMAWRVGVLVGVSAAHGHLAKLLYARAPLLPPGSRQGATELQDAALWMYYAGDVVEVALATALFGAWYRRAGRRAPVPTPADATSPRHRPGRRPGRRPARVPAGG